jgi:putative transcriptional regulator
MDMRELREKAELSTVEVAFKLKVAESTVRNWDSGRTLPTFAINQVPEVLKLYNCTLEEIATAANESRSKFNKKQTANAE